MQIGLHTLETTPPLGTYLGGYARVLDSKAVGAPLQAGAIAFEAPDGEAAIIITLDLVFAHRGFCDRLVDEVRRGIDRPAAQVMISCTHSHSTPYGTHGAPAKRFQNYADQLIELASEAACGAWATREPASMAYHRVPAALAVNRRLDNDEGVAEFGRNEQGPRDEHALVVSFRNKQHSLIGSLVNVACHPICLPPWSRSISPDWVGPMRDVVTKQTRAPCLFMQGAAADISPRHEWVPMPFRKPPSDAPPAAPTNAAACEVLGGQLGEAVAKAVKKDGTAIAAGPIAAVEADVALPLEPERDHDGNAIPYWRALLRKPRLPKWVVDKLLGRSFPWPTPVVQDGDRNAVMMRVQSMRLGDLAIAAHGSEPFNATGQAVRSAAPTEFCLFAGYANGMIGYVAPPDELPRGGYEVDTAPYLYRLPGRIAPDAEPAARATSIAQLRSLFTPAG